MRRGAHHPQLVFKALCVLHEAEQDAKNGRVRPSYGLRLALAYLYLVGDREKEWFDREPYDEFWRLATGSGEHSHGHGSGMNIEGYARTTAMRADLNGIARAAGVEVTAEVLERLGRATAGPPRPPGSISSE